MVVCYLSKGARWTAKRLRCSICELGSGTVSCDDIRDVTLESGTSGYGVDEKCQWR